MAESGGKWFFGVIGVSLVSGHQFNQFRQQGASCYPNPVSGGVTGLL